MTEVYPEKVAKILRGRSKPCKHIHVSGRRCSQRVKKDPRVSFCSLHQDPVCRECASMLGAFSPPRGWPKGTGES